MPTGFYLRILGTWSLQLRDIEFELPNRKARALISYLAFDPAEIHTRLELCGLLWPNVEEKRARASLRQCLSIVRNSLGASEGLVSISGESLSINKALLSSDVMEFLDLLDRRIGPTDLHLRCSELQKLLSDLAIVSSFFGDWISDTQANFISRTSSALKTIYQDETLKDDLRHECAKAAMSLDAFDEDAVRTLMILHFQQNNPSAALRIYGQFFKLLETEMDAEPSSYTQDLAVSIKLAQSPTNIASIPNVPAKPSPRLNTQLVTLAVLPFELVGQNGDDYLSIGLMDHLTCHLASFKSPSVISSNTTRMYLGQVPRPADVGNELNARYILVGSLRLAGATSNLTAQLVEVDGERVLWATTQECRTDDLLHLNFPIAEEIARAIVPSVDAQELRNSRAMQVEDLEPYHLVLRAKELVFKLVQDDFAMAGKLLQRAVEIGPQFSPAHSMLADWYSINIWEGWSQNPVADRVALDHHVRKALSLSPRDGRVMALWAHNRMMFNREYDFALSLIEDAIELCPNDAETLAWTVPTLANTRHVNSAVRNGIKALALSPFDPFVFRNEHFLGLALYVLGDYDQSSEKGLSCFRRAPNYRSNIRLTIAALTAAGRNQEAVELVEHHSAITPDFSVTKFKTILGMQDPNDRENFASHLLAAGMPE